MLLTNRDQLPIGEIVKCARSGRLVVFCGGGISFNSGLPLADLLRRRIIGAMRGDSDVVSTLVNSAQPLELVLERAADLSGSYGRAQIAGAFKAPGLRPTSNHKSIASLCEMGVVRAVVTTNFDVLLEQALDDLHVPYAVFSSVDEFPEALSNATDRIPLVKLHGSADNEVHKLGATLGRVAAGQLTPAKTDLLARVFSTGDHCGVIVVGYSCSDMFDVVPIVRSLCLKAKRVFFVEHLLDNDTGLEAKRQRFERMFEGFNATWMHVSTDAFVADLLCKLGIRPHPHKQLSVDWTEHIDAWGAQARPGVCSIVLGSLLADIGDYDRALRYYQVAYEQIESDLDRPVEDVFSENWHAVSSKERLTHMLSEGEMITSGDLKKPYHMQARCLGLIGQAYKNLGDYEAAQQYLAEAIRVGDQIGYPAGAWLDSLGNVWTKRGDLSRACLFYERAVEEARALGREAALAGYLCNLGTALSDLGEPDRAHELLTEALCVAEEVGALKNKALALYNLAALYNRLGYQDRSHEYNDQALKIAEDLDYGLIKRACRQGQRNDARPHGETPDDAALHAFHGSMRGEMGDHEGALQALNTALRLDPDQPSYYVARGTVLDYLARSDEALSDYNRAIRLDPKYAQAYYERAITYRDRGELGRALRDFERAIGLDGSHHQAYAYAAEVLARKGKLRKALTYAAAAREHGNANAQDLLVSIRNRLHAKTVNQALRRFREGDVTKALAIYGQVIGRDPEFATAYNYRGLVYAKLEMHELAMSDYGRAIELDPTDAQAYNNRGNLLDQLGLVAEAIEDYDKAIRIAPEIGEPYANKGVMLAKLGNWAEALLLFEQAASLGNEQAAKIAIIAEHMLQQGD
jgi:tetratricopeptide (TPR) repeat protein